MNKIRLRFLLIIPILIIIAFLIYKKQRLSPAAVASLPQTSVVKETLTVTTVLPKKENWPMTIAANGAIAPWQEAIISAEIGGMRITQLFVDVGSRVKRGQLLAIFNADSASADVRRQEAMVAQAQANLSEAKMNHERANLLKDSGALSVQQINQYYVAYESAQANIKAAKAQLDSAKIRVAQTKLTAIDDGIISSRTATLGAVVASGAELFRMIRQDRLEWRAEVSSQQLGMIHAQQVVQLTLPDGRVAEGHVRLISPIVDNITRNAIVYVDLVANAGLRAGMYASGAIQTGFFPALVVPQSAIVIRDGKSYVFEVDKTQKVIPHIVITGRRRNDQIEIKEGLEHHVQIVSHGGAFLNEGDTVRIVKEPALIKAQP